MSIFSNFCFYIQSFDKLETIDLSVIDYYEDFLFFNPRCEYNFVSLKKLSLTNVKGMNLNNMNDLLDNLKKMINLRIFIFNNSEIKETISTQIYNDLIKKLLDLDLEEIEFILKKMIDTTNIVYYNEDELKMLCTSKSDRAFDKVHIMKFVKFDNYNLKKYINY